MRRLFSKAKRQRRFPKLSLLLLLLALGIAAFCGCGKEGKDHSPLSHQVYPFTVEGILTEKGSAETYTLSLTMTAPMTGDLSFLEPSTLKGYRFALSPEGVTLHYKDLSLPYKADGLPGGNTLIPRFFSLSESELLRTEETELNSIPVELSVFETEDGYITLYKDKASATPLRLELRSSMADSESETQGDSDIVFSVESFLQESAQEPTQDQTSEATSGTTSDGATQ